MFVEGPPNSYCCLDNTPPFSVAISSFVHGNCIQYCIETHTLQYNYISGRTNIVHTINQTIEHSSKAYNSYCTVLIMTFFTYSAISPWLQVLSNSSHCFPQKMPIQLMPRDVMNSVCYMVPKSCKLLIFINVLVS